MTPVLRPYERTDLLARGFNVPELHAKQNNINRPNGGDIVRCLDWTDYGFAAAALDPKPILTHRRQMGTPSDEGYIRSCLCQSCSETPADTAGPDHCDFHVIQPSKMGRPGPRRLLFKSPRMQRSPH